MRQNNRQMNEIRPVIFERDFTEHALGSVLVSCGGTKVLCTASIENRVPHFMRDSGEGWLTAEYSLLPSSTHTRCKREVANGKPSGRTSEIQRLIGRSLRSIVDLSKLGERTIFIDTDVLQADGGTRTTAITGAMLALSDAIHKLMSDGTLVENPIKELLAAVSVGVIDTTPCLDLSYEEDSRAEVDMNVVMTETGRFVEIQGTAELQPFSREELDQLLDLASSGVSSLITQIKELELAYSK